jgi:hypothetical protein
MASGSTAMLRRAAQDSLCQASAEQFQQRAEFLPLRNRGLGPLAVTVLPIPFAMRAAGTGMSIRCLIGRPAQSTLRLSSGSSRLYGST